MAAWHRTAADPTYFLHLRTAPISAGSLREINPLETRDGPSTAFARVWSASCVAGRRGLRHTSEAAARLRTAVSTASRSRTSRATRLLERPLCLGSCRKGFAGSKGSCGSCVVDRPQGRSSRRCGLHGAVRGHEQPLTFIVAQTFKRRLHSVTGHPFH
jgi:hypothetical protein